MLTIGQIMKAAALLFGTTSLAACTAPTITLEDCIVAPDARQVTCTAFVETEPFAGFRRNLPGHAVTFSIDGRDVGRATSDALGRAAGAFALSDADPKLVEARAVVDGRALSASAHVFVWRPDRVIICVDIDNTISVTDYDRLVIKKRDERSWAIRGSRRALTALANDFHVAYVTARPRFLVEKTRAWLDDQDFPDGPVITSPGIRQAIRRTDTKKQVLAALRRDWPNILIGIGNSLSDEQVYRSSGMLGLLVHRDEDETSKPSDPDVIDLHNWATLAEFFEQNAGRLRDPAALRKIIERGHAREDLRQVPKKPDSAAGEDR